MTRPTAIPDTLTVQVPFRLVKRGGRKEMVMPDGLAAKRAPDNTLIKALARAFRWQRMLDSGAFATLADLASHEKIAPSYLTRVMRLTLLAPDLIEGILAADPNVASGLPDFLERISPVWSLQSEVFFHPGPTGRPRVTKTDRARS